VKLLVSYRKAKTTVSFTLHGFIGFPPTLPSRVRIARLKGGMTVPVTENPQCRISGETAG
jgi:hypothetical protein